MFRMNWGVKIIVAYSAFVVFMLGMVYRCTRQHFDLVSADYYAQELGYQKTIDANSNTAGLAGQVAISQSSALVTVSLPVEPSQASTVYFYRPSSAAHDVTVSGLGATVAVDKERLKNGLYKVKVSWQHGAKPYYHEQSVYVTK
jgi:nitrogen fixation protein FixH